MPLTPSQIQEAFALLFRGNAAFGTGTFPLDVGLNFGFVTVGYVGITGFDSIQSYDVKFADLFNETYTVDKNAMTSEAYEIRGNTYLTISEDLNSAGPLYAFIDSVITRQEIGNALMREYGVNGLMYGYDANGEIGMLAINAVNQAYQMSADGFGLKPGYERNAIDAYGELNPFRFQGKTDDGLTEYQRAKYKEKVTEGIKTYDKSSKDYSSYISSKNSTKSIIKNSFNGIDQDDSLSYFEQKKLDKLDRVLNALDSSDGIIGSAKDLIKDKSTTTSNPVIFVPRQSDQNDDGFGGGVLEPIVIDLDGDGIEIISRYNSPVQIDIDGDGYLERTSWVGADDGILVIDLAADGSAGGDGVITQSKEFVFTLWGVDDEYATDLAALVGEFDSNGDGVFSALDARWDEFKIWQDLNSGDDGEDKLTLPDGFIVRNNNNYYNNFRIAA